MTASKPRAPIAKTVGLIMIVLVCLCCGAAKALERDLNGPPELTAAYTSGEALLVMEDLAGALITALEDDPFTSRLWKTRECTSGWDEGISWDGFVSASVTYRFDSYMELDARSLAYSEQLATALEALGMDPVVDRQNGGERIKVSAERDDGLSVLFTTSTGLHISTGCVVDDGQSVYTPPHAHIPPAGDIQDLQNW